MQLKKQLCNDGFLTQILPNLFLQNQTKLKFFKIKKKIIHFRLWSDMYLF